MNYEELNKLQTNSENNPLTEARYRQFVRNFPKQVSVIVDIGCNNGKGGAVVRSMMPPGVKLYGLDCVKDRLDQVPPNVYEKTFYGLADKILEEVDIYSGGKHPADDRTLVVLKVK